MSPEWLAAFLFAVRFIGMASGGVPQAREEAIDAFEQCGGVSAELARCLGHVCCKLARLVGGVACAGHILGNFAGARCYLLYASRDLPRCRTLLLDGSGDGGGHAADLADGVADAADR